MKTTLHPIPKTLLALMLAFATGSLVHFTHNAEFLKSYPAFQLTGQGRVCMACGWPLRPWVLLCLTLGLLARRTLFKPPHHIA